MISLSKYISSDYSKQNGWFTKNVEQKVSVTNGTGKPSKKKIEVLTANYSNPKESLTLF